MVRVGGRGDREDGGSHPCEGGDPAPTDQAAPTEADTEQDLANDQREEAEREEQESRSDRFLRRERADEHDHREDDVRGRPEDREAEAQSSSTPDVSAIGAVQVP